MGSLKKTGIECPFTWDLDEKLSHSFDEKLEPLITVDDEPLVALMSAIMISYFRSVQKDYEGAISNLDEISKIYQNIDKR